MANQFLISAGISAQDLWRTCPSCRAFSPFSSTGRRIGVVAKNHPPRRCGQQLTGSSPRPPQNRSGGNRGRTAELRAAVLGKYQRVQVRGVIAVATRPARRENTGSAVEHPPTVESSAIAVGQLPRQQRAPSAGVLSESHAGLEDVGGVHAGGVNHLGVNVQAVNASRRSRAVRPGLPAMAASERSLRVP